MSATATQGDTELAATILYQKVRDARPALRNWHEGRSPWTSVVNAVKRYAAAAVVIKDLPLTSAERAELAKFLAQYGFPRRIDAAGDDVRNYKTTVRFAEGERVALEKAAKAAGVSVATYVRDAAVAQAFRDGAKPEAA